MTLAIVSRILLVLLLAIGHVGLWVWLYNRINATGFHRRTIKRIEKCIVLACALIPVAILALEFRSGNWGTDISEWTVTFCERSLWDATTYPTRVYGIAILAFTVVIGPIWLAHRPAFAIAKHRFRILQKDVDPPMHRENPTWVSGSLTKQCLKLPLNEILSVERNIKQLMVERLPDGFSGMRIGHLSDIHLTGQLTADFYRLAVEWVMDQRIEVLVVSGDIVDYKHAMGLLSPVFGNIDPSIPKIFVLGNHDRAYGLVDDVRLGLSELGWLDAGASDLNLQTERGLLKVCGNELPWLRRHDTNRNATEVAKDSAVMVESSTHFLGRSVEQGAFVLGISHSPDQFEWGRERGCHLLLCGHTHGGQIRFPWIGPLVAPSWYGSRYASGVFHLSPTLMHVSRGLSGVHPLRWGCTPEATVLEIVSELAQHGTHSANVYRSTEAIKSDRE